jgi:fructosamine-3-kinase
VTFWREQRLGWQLELFARKAGAEDPLVALGDRLLAKLDELLSGVDEPAVLLHGDLWSGNAAADENGQPIIFDPASYYGRREAEIGMMRLFGGFGPRCEAAYNESWPLADGAERRIPLYRLYHELNHLNLFGRSYYPACMATMESLL